MFDKVDGFIRGYNGTKYLTLLWSEIYSSIFNRIKFLSRPNINISYVVFHSYVGMKINSNNDLPLEKTLTMHNVVILIKSVFNKNQNHYYCKVLLEKCSNQLAKK